MQTSPTETTTIAATEAAVLGLLAAGQRSGYDLEKLARGSVGYFWAPARSQIYAVLPRLVDAGLAERRELVHGRGPAKQLYRITAPGREELERWLEQGPIGPEPDRNLLLLKVFFGEHMRPERLREQIRERRLEAEQLKAELVEIEAEAAARGSTDTFAALTRRYGHEWADGVIRWAELRRERFGGHMRILLAVAATGAALLAAQTAHGGPAATELAAAPRPLQLKERCVSRAERRRVVRFTSADKVRLLGVEFGRGPHAVVLAHQGGGAAGPTLCSWVPYARQLARAGYRVLAFDHRGYGSSSTPRPPRLFRIDEDVVAAVRTMRRRGATRVVVGGASLGGAAVVSAAARIQPLVQGVFTLGAPQAFGAVDALGAARTLQVPALFTSAVDDDPFNDDARALFDACASTDKRLELFPGSRHGAPTLRDPQAKALVDGWVASHLRN